MLAGYQRNSSRATPGFFFVTPILLGRSELSLRQSRTRHGAHGGGAVARPGVPERDLAAYRASRPGDGASRRVPAAPSARDRSRRVGLNRHFLGSRGQRRGTPARPRPPPLFPRKERAGSPRHTPIRSRPPPAPPPGRDAPPLTPRRAHRTHHLPRTLPRGRRRSRRRARPPTDRRPGR